MDHNVVLFHKGKVAYSRYIFTGSNTRIPLGDSTRSQFGFGIPLDRRMSLGVVEQALLEPTREYPWAYNAFPSGIIILPDLRIVELMAGHAFFNAARRQIDCRVYPSDVTWVKAQEEELEDAMQSVLEETDCIQTTLAVFSEFTLLQPKDFVIRDLTDVQAQLQRTPLKPFPWSVIEA